MKSKGYKLLKNYLHNELQLSKEEIKEILREVIVDEAKSQINKYFQKSSMDIGQTIKETISKEILGIMSGRTYSTDRDALMKRIGLSVIDQLEISMKNK